ncbi:hypothetical protein ACM66B_000548 [Microbotryomycetes sp. NB124-2]
MTERVLSDEPLNTEPYAKHLVESFVSRKVYNRNHGDVLELDPLQFELTLRDELASGNDGRHHQQLPERHLTVHNIKSNYQPTSVTGVLVCAGNRRRTMQQEAHERLERDVEGLQWDKAAVANLQFTGALLRQVLADWGVSPEMVASRQDVHVHFECDQRCEDDTFYGASIPLSKAMDETLPILIAYDMNGKPLPREHGAPLRMFVPSVIGARSVKWVQRIVLRPFESRCFYQQRDYKVLPEEATSETKDKFMQMTEPMLEYDMNAAICVPEDDQDIQVDSDSLKIHVAGYAYGGKGVPIRQVFVTAFILPNNAHTSTTEIHNLAQNLSPEAWTRAQLEQEHGALSNQSRKTFAWTLWSADVKVRDRANSDGLDDQRVAIVAFAGKCICTLFTSRDKDINGQRQPVETKYNLRGLGESSWSVVQVNFKVRSSSA